MGEGCHHVLPQAVLPREEGSGDGLKPEEITQRDGRKDNGISSMAGELWCFLVEGSSCLQQQLCELGCREEAALSLGTLLPALAVELRPR